MTRYNLFMILTAVITFVITHLSLWLRGIRRPESASLLDRLGARDMFPRDEQTKRYVASMTITSVIVMILTALALWQLFDLYDWLIR